MIRHHLHDKVSYTKTIFFTLNGFELYAADLACRNGLGEYVYGLAAACAFAYGGYSIIKAINK